MSVISPLTAPSGVHWSSVSRSRNRPAALRPALLPRRKPGHRHEPASPPRSSIATKSTSTSSRTSPRPDSPRIAGPMSGAGDPSTLRHRDEHTVAFQRDGPAIIGIAASAVDEQGLACRLAHDSLVLRTVEVEVDPPRSTVRIFYPAKVPFGSAERYGMTTLI